MHLFVSQFLKVFYVLKNEPKRPYFLGFEPLHKCHRKRLFQKGLADSKKYGKDNFYSSFEEEASLNEENVYIVDRKVLFYLNGKLVRSEDFNSLVGH